MTVIPTGTNSTLPRDRWYGAALVAVVLLTYAPGLGAPFLYDDFVFVVDNPVVESPLFALRTFGRPFAIDAGHFRSQIYRPLIPLVYSLAHVPAGAFPPVFHLLNMGLHALNAVLLFLLLRFWAGRSGTAFFAAAWWALHPANVESVQWISGLDDVLVASFVLCALLSFLKGKELISFALVLGALCTKENAVVVPGAIFLAALWRTRGGRWSAKVKTALIHSLPALALSAAYLALRFVLIGLRQMEKNWGDTAWETLLIMLRAFFRYLQLIGLPVYLRINYWEGFEEGHLLFAALGLAAFLGLAVLAWKMRRRPLVPLGCAWLLLFMLPISNLSPMSSVMGEHFLYLPLMGVAFVLAGLGAAVEKVTVTKALFSCVLGLLALGCVARIGIWKNEELFWKDIIAKEPTITGYHVNLANHYALQGRYGEAETLFHEVLSRRPGHVGAAENLARLYYDSGRYAEAENLFRQLARAFPDKPYYRAGAQKARKSLP